MQWVCHCWAVYHLESRTREVSPLTPPWEKLSHAAVSLCLCWGAQTWEEKGKFNSFDPLEHSLFICHSPSLLHAQVAIAVQRLGPLYNVKTSLVHFTSFLWSSVLPVLFPISSDYAKRLWGSKGTWVFYPPCQSLQASWRWNLHVHRATPSLGFGLRTSGTVALEERAKQVRLHKRQRSQDHHSLPRCREQYL